MDNNYSPNLNQQINQPQEFEFQPKKRGFFKRKKKLIISIIIILIVGSGVIAAQRHQKGPTYATVKVKRGILKQTVEVTGKVESVENINLNFKTTGRIKEIFVKVGDKITKGQKLAKLETKALESQVVDAQARINQAQANYKKLLAGTSAQDIAISEHIVDQKLQSLNSAKNKLANLKLKRNTELLNLKESALTTLNNETTTAQGALEEINNTLNDSDAQPTLSVTDTNALAGAKFSQEIAEVKFRQIKNNLNSIDINSAYAEVITNLENLKLTLNQISTALADTLDVLTATIVSDDLSESELDTLKLNIKNQQTKINTAKTNVQTAKSNLTNKISYYQEQINLYEDEVKQAQSALDVAVAQLNFKKTPPRQFEIEAAKAKINEAKAALDLALANLNDAIIFAPAEGIITKKNLNAGEQSSLVTPVLEMISKSNFQIEVDAPESDIAKIKVGQKAEITLDAFGDEQIFNGRVAFIDPAETIIQDVVYYKIKIQFDKSQDNIKSGMTANVTIYTNSKENVLYIPARAVKTENGEKYVEVVTSQKNKKIETEKRRVITGLYGDDGIEITSGLKEGDEIVTFVKK